jgi:hypothetical protein
MIKKKKEEAIEFLLWVMIPIAFITVLTIYYIKEKIFGK